MYSRMFGCTSWFHRFDSWSELYRKFIYGNCSWRGVGKLAGTVLGSSVIGFCSIFTEKYTSATIAKAIVLLVVIVFLQKRPQGFFVVKSRGLDE